MPATTSPRHRERGAPLTALDDVRRCAAQGLVGAGRRTIVAAGTSGLVVSMLSASATAPAAAPAEHGASTALDTQALTASARAAVITAPGIQVPAEAAWSFDAPAIAVTPNPTPEPVPAAASGSDSIAIGHYSAEGVAIPDTVAGNAVLEIAARYIGVPYVYGGSTPDGFDCSGFTQYVFAQLGISLPRSSSAQGSVGTVIPADQARPGDLMWWDGHVAIYAGGNLQIDSSQPGTTIQFREIHRSNPTFIRIG